MCEPQQVPRCEKARCWFRSQGFKFFDQEDCNRHSRSCISYTHTPTLLHARIIWNTFVHKTSFEWNTIKSLPRTKTPSRHSITFKSTPPPSALPRLYRKWKHHYWLWTKTQCSHLKNRSDLDFSQLRHICNNCSLTDLQVHDTTFTARKSSASINPLWNILS